MSAKDNQIGGSHYKDMKIQPLTYIQANGIGFVEGSIIKYVSRWKQKGGVEDLKKARHFIDLLIEYEQQEPQQELQQELKAVKKLPIHYVYYFAQNNKYYDFINYLASELADIPETEDKTEFAKNLYIGYENK